MSAWEEATKSTGKIRFFADASGELARASGLDVDAKPLGGVRFKRFSALLHDGKIQQIKRRTRQLVRRMHTQHGVHLHCQLALLMSAPVCNAACRAQWHHVQPWLPI